jgi:hypothetical protein
VSDSVAQHSVRIRIRSAGAKEAFGRGVRRRRSSRLHENRLQGSVVLVLKGRELDRGGYPVTFGSPSTACSASEAREAVCIGRGAVVKPRTPPGAVHRLVLWAGGLSTAGAILLSWLQ